MFPFGLVLGLKSLFLRRPDVLLIDLYSKSERGLVDLLKFIGQGPSRERRRGHIRKNKIKTLRGVLRTIGSKRSFAPFLTGEKERKIERKKLLGSTQCADRPPVQNPAARRRKAEAPQGADCSRCGGTGEQGGPLARPI